MKTRNLTRLAATVAGIAIAATFASASPSFGYRMIQVSGTGRFTSGSLVSCDTAGGFTHRNSGTFQWYLNTQLQGAGKDNNITPAMTAWNNVSGTPYQNTYAGTTTDGFSTDGRNTMIWENGGACSGGGCLALTALVVQSRQLIVETDVTFNNGFAWHTNGDQFDVQTVTTHELGHSMGIHHTEVQTTPYPTMRTPYFGTDGRSLESDDRAAIACSAKWYVSPSFDSLHESTTCNETKGWIWNSQVPNGDINVEFWADNNLIGIYPASTCRADLAGKGDTCHGFTIVPKAINMINDGTEWIITFKNSLNGQNLNGTGHSLYCSARLFTSQTPTEQNLHPGETWTVGNDISSSRDGLITHLRYYRSANETGVHTLKLYTTAGSQLASVSVDFGSSIGARWEQGQLSTPVAITANTHYIVTVTTTNQQSKTSCGFSSPIVRGPLTGWGGRWIAGTGFPTTSSCSNFWTDFVFNQ
jgi:hypothetical protein